MPIKRKLFACCLTAALVLAAFTAARADEPLHIVLVFPDGTQAQAAALESRHDVYVAYAPESAAAGQVILQVSGGGAASCSPQSGSRLYIPVSGGDASSAAYLPISLMDGQGTVFRRIRLYLSAGSPSSAAENGMEEKISAYAALTRDAELLDAQGNVHPLSGTLARDTLVHLTAVRTLAQGEKLYRVDINGEIAYLPENALSFTVQDQNLSLSALQNAAGSGEPVAFAVTLYETGIRSGKGNTDRNLLGRAPKDELVLVFSRMMDDDGKLLDLVYCPSMNLLGYAHDTQLRHLAQEDLSGLLDQSGGTKGQMPEFTDAYTADETPLFAYPDRNSAAVTQLEKGKKVFLYTCIQNADGYWYMAQADEALGYLPSDIVIAQYRASSSGPESALSEAGANDAALSRFALSGKTGILLYAAPSLTAECAGRLGSGELLLITEDRVEAEGLSWLRVDTGMGSGYVLAEQTERLMIGSYLLSN